MIAGVPAFGASCMLSEVLVQVPKLPVAGSSEYMVSPLPVTNSRGPSARNEGVCGSVACCQKRRVTLKLFDAVDWLPNESLMVADHPTELSALGTDEVGSEARFAVTVKRITGALHELSRTPRVSA